MFIPFFLKLKEAKIPVTLREFLTLIEAMEKNLVSYDIEGFYYLARAALVKDERNLDRFDVVFSESFKGVERVGGTDGIEQVDLPEEWLRKMAEKHLSKEEMKEIQSLGGWEKLMETLKQRLKEATQTPPGSGTSAKFKNLDDSVELGTRNIKVALKRLRRWVRDGADEELDLNSTIKSTAENGYLDVKTRPERRNAVKVLLFLDIGGSMDDHVKLVEELFSAARIELKNLEYFYFHNCLYEGVWKDNKRRHNERMSTWDVLHTYGSDYKIIFVGDAAMSPYEVVYPGGSVEHWNEESGEIWLRRVLDKWNNAIWLNPVEQRYLEIHPVDADD
ncbi:hypothetical protein GQR58_005075 [Nymphon striatum]|nr:hypothetical protein GQR58_005075 [Nymphon striatum]